MEIFSKHFAILFQSFIQNLGGLWESWQQFMSQLRVVERNTVCLSFPPLLSATRVATFRHGLGGM